MTKIMPSTAKRVMQSLNNKSCTNRVLTALDDLFALTLTLAYCERALTAASPTLASLTMCKEIAQEDSLDLWF